MLHGKLVLHDITDTEAFCARIVERRNLNLSYHDQEDLVAYLVETAWELSLRYRPGGMNFSAWALANLRQRTIDWQRSRHGRTRWQFKDRVYERRIPDLVPLEHRPEQPDPSGTLDPGSYSDTDTRRLLRTRGSKDTRGTNTVGTGETREAA